ncbi:ABC transporter permease [Flavisolibacter sp. BT320]|nr:ABC transporter permease [Flavisolibacter longurius]
METNSEVKASRVVQPNLPPKQWAKVIEPKFHLLDLRLNELWRYRDLIGMFVRRDFVANFKQTILGPLWFFIQPLLTTITYVFIFGRIAQLSTDGMNMLLFYLSGITIWNYFSETMTRTSNVFTENQDIFGKVYFPRLTLPVSVVISNLFRFGIQFLLFLVFFFYFYAQGDVVKPNLHILLLPVLLLIMGLLGLGLGLIFTSLTNKYKDLSFLLSFGTQLLMYATPVIYPVSSIPPKYLNLILANPITPVVETFRYAFLGVGFFSWKHLGYSFGVTLVILTLGVIIFNRVQKTFSDTV